MTRHNVTDTRLYSTCLHTISFVPFCFPCYKMQNGLQGSTIVGVFHSKLHTPVSGHSRILPRPPAPMPQQLPLAPTPLCSPLPPPGSPWATSVCSATCNSHTDDIYTASLLVLLQNLKVELKQMCRQFINPLYHLLLTLLPWLPTAKRERASTQAVDKVSAWYAQRSLPDIALRLFGDLPV